jgi:glutamine amidotransferase
MLKVLVINYGMGNIGSMKRAIEECGAYAIVGNSTEYFNQATHIILPGVGSFDQGMHNLKTMGIVENIREQVQVRKKPMLGVCLGMQMLASRGQEGSPCDGLGLIEGSVELMESSSTNEKIPHVGWNSVNHAETHRIFNGIPSGTDFYFVHSYSMICFHAPDVIGTTDYCRGITAVVAHENVWGTQFHPEKSQRMGHKLLSNFLVI